MCGYQNKYIKQKKEEKQFRTKEGSRKKAVLKNQGQKEGTEMWGRISNSIFRTKGRDAVVRLDAKPVTIGLEMITANIS